MIIKTLLSKVYMIGDLDWKLAWQGIGTLRPKTLDISTWDKTRALARAEHPVIDVEKLEDKPSALFSSTEREIVAKFLENVKSELSTV